MNVVPCTEFFLFSLFSEVILEVGRKLLRLTLKHCAFFAITVKAEPIDWLLSEIGGTFISFLADVQDADVGV